MEQSFDLQADNMTVTFDQVLSRAMELKDDTIAYKRFVEALLVGKYGHTRDVESVLRLTPDEMIPNMGAKEKDPIKNEV